MEVQMIEKYLDTHSRIYFHVHQAELDDPENISRYFELLAYLEKHPQRAGQFCNALELSFDPDCGEHLWKNEKVVSFVRQLTSFPFLFFLAEKEGDTLKFLAALSCCSGEKAGDNLALDAEKFHQLLQQQMKGLLVMSQAAGFSPENAQSLMDCIFAYYGLDN
jgi:hypothetical protein